MSLLFSSTWWLISLVAVCIILCVCGPGTTQVGGTSIIVFKQSHYGVLSSLWGHNVNHGIFGWRHGYAEFSNCKITVTVRVHLRENRNSVCAPNAKVELGCCIAIKDCRHCRLYFWIITPPEYIRVCVCKSQAVRSLITYCNNINETAIQQPTAGAACWALITLLCYLTILHIRFNRMSIFIKSRWGMDQWTAETPGHMSAVLEHLDTNWNKAK